MRERNVVNLIAMRTWDFVEGDMEVQEMVLLRRTDFSPIQEFCYGFFHFFSVNHCGGGGRRMSPCFLFRRRRLVFSPARV